MTWSFLWPVCIITPAHLAQEKEPKTVKSEIRQGLVPPLSLGYVTWSKSFNPWDLSFQKVTYGLGYVCL